MIAQSADKMFSILEQLIPDLIIMDVNMPEVSGFKAIETLKSNTKYQNIPVVFFTSKKDKESIQKGIKLGAVDYWIKPLFDAELTEYVKLHINPDINSALKPIILAIDDSPAILTSINHILNDKYTVYTLPESSRMKDLLNYVTPDLFILDYNMPVLNGLDLIPIIRNNTNHSETPILILTGEGTANNFATAIKLGANGMLTKPVNETLLRERVAEQLKQYIIRRRLHT
jgi:PleD family two-component response regulator